MGSCRFAEHELQTDSFFGRTCWVPPFGNPADGSADLPGSGCACLSHNGATQLLGIGCPCTRPSAPDVGTEQQRMHTVPEGPVIPARVGCPSRRPGRLRYSWLGCDSKTCKRTAAGRLGARPPFASFHSQCPLVISHSRDRPGSSGSVDAHRLLQAQAAGTWVLLWEQVAVGAMSPVWCEQKILQQISMIGFGTWQVGWTDGTGEGRGTNRRHTRRSQIDCLPG